MESLHRIIEEAEKELVLVSPFIKADEETKELLGEQKRSTVIDVVYGKRELSLAEKRFLEGLGIKLTFLEHLHAKCYLNESEALLTSMNLYESSQENDEMGILVSKKEDDQLYEDIHRQVKKYIDRGKPAIVPVAERGRGYSAKVPPQGFCIQCGNESPFVQDNLRPYCIDHFDSSRNPDKKEKHCHMCGNKYAASRRNPFCPACKPTASTRSRSS